MLFNSFSFLIFFPTVCLLYFALQNQKSRLILLFLSSCFFYGFFIPKYLLILFAVIGIDFYAGKKIEITEDPLLRKTFLAVSLVANISILLFFKYANFLSENLNSLAHVFHWNYSIPALQIVLPIGLSFHTFQSMSYIFEVYKKRTKAEKSLLHYSVYVLYFPQLVAGPIERPQNIFPQLHQFHPLDYERTVSGLFLITQGLFRKVVIADSLAPLANTIFDHPSNFGMIPTLLGMIAFSFQIYCDFAGYSDIARGVSRILGIELMLNFNKPYFATSISEFWRRWHISLSTWFRDYLYIPLGGNQKGNSRTYLNLFIVFTVSGLWHGANWTFIIWGALHGLFLLIEQIFLKPIGLSQWPKWLGKFYVYILVLFAWVFFRASDFSNAITVINGLFRSPRLGLTQLKSFQIIEFFIFIPLMLTLEWADHKINLTKATRNLSLFPRWVIYWASVIIFLFTAQFNGNQFIYFQF